MLAGGEPVDVQHLPPAVRRGGGGEPVEKAPELRDLVAAEPSAPPRALTPEDARHRDELITLLREHHGNIAAVARVMGKARMQVHRWVKRYDLRLSDFR